MVHLHSNLKFLRKKHSISQGEIADEFQLARTTYGDYERGKTEPNLQMLVAMANKYGVALDDLIASDLTRGDLEILRNDDFRVLAISVDSDNNGNIELVETKAEAGYLESFSDPEYIKDLPKIAFPKMPEGTYRGFEIHGDSMLPMESGSIVLCSYVERLSEIKNDNTYVIVSKADGLVYKRVQKSDKDKKLILFSDNESYNPYEIDYSEIAEIWKYYAHLSFSDAKSSFNYMLEEKLSDIQKKVTDIQQKIK